MTISKGYQFSIAQEAFNSLPCNVHMSQKPNLQGHPWASSRTSRRSAIPRPRCKGILQARQNVDDADASPVRPSEPSADLFEEGRWRWPAVSRNPRSPPTGPPLPTAAPSRPKTSFRSSPPPPPPPPPPPTRPASWAEALFNDDPDLRALLTEYPELWADLQQRAGKQDAYIPPPNIPDADAAADPAAYERQVQAWLRARRARGGGAAAQAGARQDDEIASVALVYLAIALPLLAVGIAAAW